MIITFKELFEVNEIQVDILRAVCEVCDKLNIKCYMVHGSLLGSIRNGKFVPGDDDIDIAMHRKDYELFLKEAPKYLPEYYFVQNHESDKNYPLNFAKVRDSRTTYIIDVARKLDINHGIYIDLFPIDNAIVPGFKSKVSHFINKICSLRISSVFVIENDTKSKKLVRFMAKILCPSVKCAINHREKSFKSRKFSGFIQVTGGKPKESQIPYAWFDGSQDGEFEGVKIDMPKDYDSYLTKIYGDYKNRTLIENKENDENNIEVNACCIDISKPYTEHTSDWK